MSFRSEGTLKVCHFRRGVASNLRWWVIWVGDLAGNAEFEALSSSKEPARHRVWFIIYRVEPQFAGAVGGRDRALDHLHRRETALMTLRVGERPGAQFCMQRRAQSGVGRQIGKEGDLEDMRFRYRAGLGLLMEKIGRELGCEVALKVLEGLVRRTGRSSRLQIHKLGGVVFGEMVRQRGLAALARRARPVAGPDAGSRGKVRF